VNSLSTWLSGPRCRAMPEIGYYQRHLHEALLQKATPADAMKAAADEVNKTTTAP